MKLRILAGAMLAFAPIASAAAMPVSTFLAKADKLQKKGALPIFSGDLKLLTGQVKTDAAELRAEKKAAAATGGKRLIALQPPE